MTDQERAWEENRQRKWKALRERKEAEAREKQAEKERQMIRERKEETNRKNRTIESQKRRLRNTYGISLGDYNELFSQQGGKCAICRKHQSEFSYPLYVDHDHKTGKVRGLLCCGCNTGLGHFEKLHKEMQDYLTKYDGFQL